ncbi:TspO/MBR family protein [Gemmatimonas groenlandica]|uniref:Tryptophan-rich sensory protein n=1 Tax=Gemmatimonas groenlandica TaxID=2732249 RepID=A0A6M4IRN1_9BACT|nr:TspO/MBR family protein [Gemmatimonas groenlandica]QJR36076.1 tryptophan-rich sensory protein [Gemmatimonas groenlandica]
MPLTLSRQKAGNVLALVTVIALNGLAATGAMSGDSIGVIANRYRSLFLPADYVFGIWSVIYLGLIASVVYQALPTASAERAVRRLGIWWAVTGALNVAWISLFSFGQFALALPVMVIFLVTLVVIGERVRTGSAPSLAEQIFLVWPQDIYLAWISVALIANSFQFAQAVQWGGFGIAESTWAVAMMFVATLLGTVMAWGRGNWLFPLVVAWALRGIGARYPEVAAIADTTRWLVPAGVVVGMIAWAAGRRRGDSLTSR